MVWRRRPRPGVAASLGWRPPDSRDLDRATPRRSLGCCTIVRGNTACDPRRGNPLMTRDVGLDQSRGLLAAAPVIDFDAGPPRVSFEFFPPKTPEMEGRLWEVVKRLEALAPRFVSVTYGAGGSTRERTHATVRRIRHQTPLEPAAHLTCVAATRAEIDAVAFDYWQAGV